MNNFSFLTIEDFFKPHELDAIWKELEFINSDNHLLPPELTGQTYVLPDGKRMKSNKGVFLETIYKDNNFSGIMKYINENLTKERVDLFANANPLYRNIYQVNYYSHLVSYYEQSDYYEPHSDISNFTFIVWLFKEPKAFSGGELVLNDINHTVEIKNNMAILFPSAASHQVLPVKMNDPSMFDKGLGRYAITCFMNYNPMIGNLPDELKGICSKYDGLSYYYPMKFIREARGHG